MRQAEFRIDLAKVEAFRDAEVRRFRERTPKSRALYQTSRALMPSGVPACWMAALYPGTEIFAVRGAGCHFEDADGFRYLDMIQCDLSMACGYAPEAVTRAVAERFRDGSHFLLPTEDSIAVCRNLAERFGMPSWQFTLSASTANTEAIRFARFATGRDKVLVFDGKYHGHIDETLVGVQAPEFLGLPKNITARTIVVPFNDLEAVERALKSGDVACVMTEPVMTNIGVIFPDDGFHEGLRRLTRDHGALLVIDETHTQVATYGGFTRLWQLQPDILTIGKCVGGGVPVGIYGVTRELAALIEANTEPQVPSGLALALGGTTYGNALTMAAVRAVLEHVLTEEGYRRVTELGKRLADGIDAAIARHDLPWRAQRLGNRSGVYLARTLPRNAHEASRCISKPLNWAARAYLANRGVWEPTYINGPCISFAHTEADVDLYLERFDDLMGQFRLLRH